MKNETKRSVTAVLLAAAMLLSTQGITAFADTEKIELPATEITQTTEKPETPEKPAEDGEEGEQGKPETPEKPAEDGEEGEQEKPETPEKPAEGEGEEQEEQEKPEEGEGEEQEKPEEKPAEGEGEEPDKPETETPETPADPSAVAPTLLDSAEPLADISDVPNPKPGYEPLSGYTTYVDDCEVQVYTNTSNGGTIELIDQNTPSLGTFPLSTGFRVFSAIPLEGWVSSWDHEVSYRKGGIAFPYVTESNPTWWAFKTLYCFSKEDHKDTAYTKSDSIIQVNRHAGLGESASDDEHIVNKAYYRIYANFNPLVTVNVGENGTVTYNNTEVSHKDSGKKVEVEYGTAPGFTIDPVDGYKVASVTFGDDIITADEDGTYFLPSVTEPTTLNVEFEKAEDVITVMTLMVMFL